MASAEDQDLALRHAALGGLCGYIPEAEAIHNDDALDVRSYCRRVERGAEQLIPFVRRYPGLEENLQRMRANGPLDWLNDSIDTVLRKLAKRGLSGGVALAGMFTIARRLEQSMPDTKALDYFYRLLIGVHLLRGYRAGLVLESSLAVTASPVGSRPKKRLPHRP